MQLEVKFRRRRNTKGAFALLASLSLLLAGCAMSNSSLIDASSGRLGCESSAGVYYLGRTYFQVQIANAIGTDNYYMSGVKPVRRVDGDHGFCLDYLGSITAEESFVVKKTSEGLLKQITSNSDDKSVEIGQKLVQAFFVGLSGNPAFPDATAIAARANIVSRVSNDNVVDQTYDPFNEADTALLNNSIKDYGFCLVLEGQILPAGYRSYEDYCDAPLRHTKLEREIVKAALPRGPMPSVLEQRQGIFYRPRRTRTIYLFIKRDLRRAGGWKLRASQAVAMENDSPTMFVGIDRTFFASRRTTVDFDDGVLTDINITKGSELVGFVSIPLYIAQSIVALPAQIVQVRINQDNRRAQLIDARKKLIDAETALLRLQQEQAAASGQANGNNPAAKANVFGAGNMTVSRAQESVLERCRALRRESEDPEKCEGYIATCDARHAGKANKEALFWQCVTNGAAPGF